ncbi:type VII secretion system-associated protein [Streptomyces sp. M10(2022)]
MSSSDAFDSSPEAPDSASDAGIPTPPEEFIKAAKLAPDHWLSFTDPTWQGEGPPPAWAVVGQWRSDPDGEIVEWQDNEEYRPSPEAYGWPEPTDAVDAAIQLATTGYGSAEDVTSALAKAEVAVLVTSSGAPVSASAPDGTPVVPIFTSQYYLHLAGRLGFEQVKFSALLGRLPEGHSLCINSSAPVSMVMTTDGLDEIAAAAEAVDEKAAETARPADDHSSAISGSGEGFTDALANAWRQGDAEGIGGCHYRKGFRNFPRRVTTASRKPRNRSGAGSVPG